MKTIYFIIFLFFCISISAQQEYFSNGNNLNIREFPDQNSAIIGKLNKGEKVEVLEISNDWAKIQYQNNQYFVSAKFLSEKSDSKKDLGFKEGFKYTYLFTAGILIFLFTAPEVMKRKVNDRRFKSGTRQDKVPETIMWKNFLISLVIALPVALIGGIICWIF